MSAPAVTVDRLSVRYVDAERQALRDVSFAIQKGETALILGPSGSGKSTLALCLNGLIPHLIEAEMQGEVRIWGHPPMLASTPGVSETPGVEARSPFVGEVFQDPETQMVMPRVDEEVAFGLENLGLSRRQMPDRIAEALALVGLQDRPRAWVDGLSGGQKQRLALAAVLAMQPGILVLDEPTANLDPAATRDFFQTLATLKTDLGMTIVIIEHRLDAVLSLVDRIIVLRRDGALLAQGTPQEVFSAYREDMAAEGIWLPMTCRLTQALRERGWPLTGCPLSLDEVEAALRSRGEAFGGSAAEALVRTQAAGESTSSPPNASPLPAVAISRLTFAYPDSQPSLNDANLSIARGRFFALVGANGSGKTTLAKHLVGLLRPASGTVHVLGHDTRRQSASELARQVGYVFQNPEHQFVTERVADELAYSLHGRWGQEETDRRVRDLLSTFGLEGYEEDNPFALSQGQKRRLSVATMLALHQPILILDEPTFGQDQQSTSALMETLKTLHQAGTTIVFITHDMQLVAEYADEVAVMHEGRVIFQGTPHALFQQPAVLEQASLVLPPLAELAHRLGLPPLLTVEEWRAWADATAPKASHLP